MKRKFLEDLGLDKETVDAIITENGADIENARSSEASKFDTERKNLQSQITDLQGQVSQRDTDLADVQKKLTEAQENAEKLTEAQNAIVDLQSKYDTERKDWEDRNAKQAYEFAIRERANALNFSSAAAKKEFIREAIGKEFKMEKDTLLGFDDYVKLYKESDPGAFVPDKGPDPEPAPQPDEPNPKKPDIVLPGNPGTPGRGKSLSDMMKAKNANPDMVVNFDK